MKKISGLVVAIYVCFTAAFIGSVVTRVSVKTWYQTLKKPAWNPPDWIFAPVWSTLFLLMAISIWLIWLKREEHKIEKQITLFSIQLITNILWSTLFFGMQNPDLAFVGIIVLIIAIIATMVAFLEINKTAGYLMIPYILWVIFAAFLNVTICWLN
ncbi:TspO/MBR family protein [Candidatus Uabimicrobium sp. HlEnr_7]|uniref:TspO/MBR family protein n=1 Tax=Candidatus Uabimicrobium helgolandensis TaxID=3095367 RepID=UPI0035576B90